MAIGATESDVHRQFLIEAVTLSFIGGAIGILLGLVTTFLIPRVLGWAVSVSMIALVVAVIFSIMVGIFFGFYPARKAARLNPIEALRYE
jgi:putative ABC transport system permease protein